MHPWVVYLSLNPELRDRLVLTVALIALLSLGRFLANFLIRKRITDAGSIYRYRRWTLHVYTALIVLLIGPIWVEGISSLTTFLGLASAGVAIAMHDTIANIAGWLFIISRKPFTVGDRIQIGETKGDVVDIRIFQFSVSEIGNWVDADQSTGRIVHVPNSKVLREPLANYHIGFEYIWNEIRILITFESHWRKAKGILEGIARDKTERLSAGAREQIRRAAEKYLMCDDPITPTVFTTVKESGVLLTIRYLVDPRERRTTEQEIWETTLDAFAREGDIELAYPTTRFYAREHPKKASGGDTGPSAHDA